MGKLIERCAGIDIGKRFLVCCVMTGAAHEEPRSETRRFDTTVPGLKRLRNWLHEERVTDVVMESTRDRTGFQFSIYWRAMSRSCWPILKR